MKFTKKLTRAMSLLLLLTMIVSVLSGAIVAQAEEGGETPKTTPDDFVLIDTDVVGSITVHKYVATTESGSRGDATGNTGDAPTSNAYSPLKDAVFILAKIYDADVVVDYYNGSGDTPKVDGEPIVLDKDKLKVEGFAEDETTHALSVTSVVYNETNTISSGDYFLGKTDGNGEIKFTNVPVGFYILKEITQPPRITTPCEDTLFTVPMVNTATSTNDNTKWKYQDIHVYPKNISDKSSVEITKVGVNGTEENGAIKESLLTGVQFVLYKCDFTDANRNLPNPLTWASVNNDGEGKPEPVTTSTDGKASYSDLEAGPFGSQYKLVEISAPDGYIVDTNPVYFYIDQYRTIHWNTASEPNGCSNTEKYVTGATEPRFADATVEEEKEIDLSFKLYNERPTLEKRVQKNANNDYSTGDWLTDEEYAINEEITYQIEAYVPNNVTQLAKFEICDVPTVGITDTTTGITVTCDGEAVTGFTAATKDAVSGTSGAGFTLTFNDTAKAAIAGKKIVIQYKAKLNENAVIAGDGNENTATVTYSDIFGSEVPAGEDNTPAITEYAIEDVARVYTYEFKITKYKDEAAAGKEAEGVEFILQDKAGSEIGVVAVTEVGEDGEAVAVPGVYRIAADGETAMNGNMVTNSDGNITVKGVENTKAGTLEYYLKEMKTIPNYNLLSTPFKIEVKVDGRTTTWNETVQTGTAKETIKKYTSTSGITTAEAEIVNKAGFVLPQTGSMGYLIFCAAGLLLIGGGAALIFGGRKKVIR